MGGNILVTLLNDPRSHHFSTCFMHRESQPWGVCPLHLTGDLDAHFSLRSGDTVRSGGMYGARTKAVSCMDITLISNQLNNSIYSLGLIWTWCMRPPCCMHQVIPKLHRQEYQMIEFFAGKGHLSSCMRASGYSTASFDILYTDGRKAEHGSNFMDINSPSGFAYFGFTDR